MGFKDRLLAWLRGEDPQGGRTGRIARPSAAALEVRRRRRSRSRSEHPSSAFDGAELLDFARSRRGVELYLEPRTRLYGHSVLMVADDGEYLRRPVPDAMAARQFCSQHGLPLYDAARTGYPRRVRDYDQGVRPRRVELDDLPPWPGADEEPPPAPPVTDEP